MRFTTIALTMMFSTLLAANADAQLRRVEIKTLGMD